MASQTSTRYPLRTSLTHLYEPMSGHPSSRTEAPGMRSSRFALATIGALLAFVARRNECLNSLSHGSISDQEFRAGDRFSKTQSRGACDVRIAATVRLPSERDRHLEAVASQLFEVLQG